MYIAFFVNIYSTNTVCHCIPTIRISKPDIRSFYAYIYFLLSRPTNFLARRIFVARTLWLGRYEIDNCKTKGSQYLLTKRQRKLLQSFRYCLYLNNKYQWLISIFCKVTAEGARYARSFQQQ